jgi:hypothetical protein
MKTLLLMIVCCNSKVQKRGKIQTAVVARLDRLRSRFIGGLVFGFDAGVGSIGWRGAQGVMRLTSLLERHIELVSRKSAIPRMA